MNRFLFFLIVLLVTFTSCKNEVFYEKIDTINDEKWNMDQKFVYEFEITDSTQFYDIYFNVRNAIDYPYQNLYVFLTNQFPSGLKMVDTLGCTLCDPFGKWYGKGSGRIKDNKFLLRKQVRFHQKGKYIFTVQHGMRDENLQGIANFGITFERHKPSKKNE